MTGKDKDQQNGSNISPAREMMAELKEGLDEGIRLSVSNAQQLADAADSGKIGSFQATSSFASCLLPLLTALGWRGKIRGLFEALPHFANSLNLIEFRNTLAYLHYKTTHSKAHLSNIDERLFPCLFVTQDNTPIILLCRDEKGIRIFDSEDGKEKYIQDTEQSGAAYFITSEFTSQTNKKTSEAPPTNWIGDLLKRFKATIRQLFAMTLVLNLLALMVPLFIMTIYDQVIPSQSTEALAYLVAGISFALLCEIGLRVLKARFVAYLGARVENIVANATFQKLLALPPTMTESSPIGSQIARLKEFDTIKGLFSSTLVNVILELPFMVIFLVMIAVLGGTLAYIPIAMMAIFAFIGIIMLPVMKRNVTISGRSKAQRHSFLVETFSSFKTIKESAAEKSWLGRYRSLSAETAFNHFKSAQVSLLLQSLSQAIMMGAGIATMGFGVMKILEAEMTIGALIACMALVWRVLSPLQSLFLTLTRLEQTINSIKQINQLMRLKVEHDPSPSSLSQKEFSGSITFDRVSFRYRPESEPALLGASFEVKAGEMLAIMGNNAAGKSTVLKLLLAMNKPQAGQIILDGMDIRQINTIALRQSIAYVPQEAHFFHGTIAQNILLSNPTASREEIEEACTQANVLDEINLLERGFDTRIGDQSVQNLPTSFKQRLSLARAFLKKSPILLLDEPAKTLDFEGDEAFMKSLQAMKGKITIIMVSHRPSHIKMADKLLILESGMVKQITTPETIFPPRQEQRA